MTLRSSSILLGLLAACNSSLPGQETDGGQASSSSGGSTTESISGSGVVEPATTAVDSSGSSPGSTGAVDFIADPDVTHPGFACDLHVQDCGDGFKCVPISVDSWWDGTACVPVVPDPQGIGEACELPDPATGFDDCGWGQYCWQVNESGVGECIGLCLADPGSEWDYYCEDRQAEPSIGCQECFCLCIRPCDPLAQDCSESQGCYPVSDGWQCAPDASEGAGQGAGCEFINGCVAGHVCLDASVVPSCEAPLAGCCSAICDTSLPDTCPGQELGMSCVPWYEQGSAPPGYENVGVCAVQP